MCPEFVLPVTQEEYEKAGSKFITFNTADPVGKLYYKPIELDMPDWDTPGQSIKFPIRITEEGPDFGKEDKLSAGVSQIAIWKLKDILKALDVAVEMRVGADKKKHPIFDSAAVAGQPAIGCWQIQEGHKDGNPNNPIVKYPKLVSIYPTGYEPPAVSELV